MDLNFISNCNIYFRVLRFHVTLGARGFSCTVSGFGQVVSSANTCRPAADDSKLPVAREKKTSGTQGTSSSLDRQKLHFVCMYVVVIFQPIITLQEVNAGLALTPKEQVVTVTSGPVLGITFSQFRATVTGSVKCIGKLHVLAVDSSYTCTRWGLWPFKGLRHCEG